MSKQRLNTISIYKDVHALQVCYWTQLARNYADEWQPH